MKFSLPLLTLALSSLAAAAPLVNSEIPSNHLLERDVQPEAAEAGGVYEKRMLSAALKKGHGAAPKYAGKKLSATDVAAIKQSGLDVEAIVKQHPGALVLALGNSPAYTITTIPGSVQSSLKIYEAPVSGAIPPKVPAAMAAAYANNVLKPIIGHAGKFTSVILVDIFTTGASKSEYVGLLAACEAPLKLPKGALSGHVSQIAIVDAKQAKPASHDVPIAGVVTMKEAGLARELTDEMFPRIVAHYPSTSFANSPDKEATTQQLDAKGRTEVLKALQH